jgi:hypothetical protein
VATSATIADARGHTGAQLREFLADLAGVNADRVAVVYGQRQVPPLPAPVPQTPPPRDLDALGRLSPEARFDALVADPCVRQWRTALIQQPRLLSELARMAWHEDSAQAREATLRLLDLCTQAVNTKAEPLLPLRGHFFHRALNGLWACVNAACPGRRGTRLDDAHWAFGRLFLERRQHCEACGSPV